MSVFHKELLTCLLILAVEQVQRRFPKRLRRGLNEKLHIRKQAQTFKLAVNK